MSSINEVIFISKKKTNKFRFIKMKIIFISNILLVAIIILSTTADENASNTVSEDFDEISTAELQDDLESFRNQMVSEQQSSFEQGKTEKRARQW